MLKGSLDDFTLPDIFRLLSACSRTGCVEVNRSAGTGKVFLKEGEVYYAESSLTRDPLGQKLVRARLITELQLRQALDEHAESGKRLGEVLVSSGTLSQEEIEGAVRQQIEDAVFDLLRWELGEFAWQAGEEFDAEVPISVTVENLIMEASRKLEELESIQKKIPSETAILAMTPTPPEDAAEINITPEEWRILVQVNGARSVSDLAESAGLDNFSAMRILFGLASAGLIEVIDAPPTPALDEFAAALEDESPDDGDAQKDVVASWETEAVEDGPALQDVTDTEVPVESQDAADTEVSAGFNEDDASSTAPIASEIGALDDVVDTEVPTDPEQVTETEVSAELEGSADAEMLLDDAVGAELSTEDAMDNDSPMSGPSEFSQFLNDDSAPGLQAENGSLEDSQNPFDIEPPPAADPNNGDIPVATEPEDAAEAVVDRLAAVKELADLFDQGNPDAAGPPYPAEIEAERLAKEAEMVPAMNGNGDGRRRVEDDEEITKGLISRLIDGVKGL